MAEKSREPAVYGADMSGLVCGYQFEPNRAAVPIDTNDALRWMRESAEERGKSFLWLHFNLSSAPAEQWMRENLELPEAYFETLHEGSRSTRVDYAENTLIAVVNDVLYDFTYDAEDIATLWVMANQRLLISCRRQHLRSIDLLRMTIKNGEQIASSTELLVHLLRLQADVLIRINRETTLRTDDIEDRLLLEGLPRKRAALGAMRRMTVRLQRLLAPEPAALFRLLNRPPSWVARTDIEELRQATEEFSSVINDMTGLQERIRLLQEELATRLNEQTNRSLFLLTVVTVLAIPFNVAGGLFGMNVGGIPFATHPEGFWIVLGVVVALTFAAGLFAMWRRRK